MDVMWKRNSGEQKGWEGVWPAERPVRDRKVVRPSGFEPPTFCLRRLKTFLVFSWTCMRFLDAIWTEPSTCYRDATFFMATTFIFPDFKFAASIIFSDRRSSTSDTCWLGDVRVVQRSSRRARAPSAPSARQLRYSLWSASVAKVRRRSCQLNQGMLSFSPAGFRVTLDDGVFAERLSAQPGEDCILGTDPLFPATEFLKFLNGPTWVSGT